MKAPVVALIGAPNTGKSSLFNVLTGARQKVGNYPGVTVEKKMGQLKTERGTVVTVIDLPGTYSLDPQSPDERIVADILFGRMNIPEYPDVILAVADATNLERTLGIVLALKPCGLPIIVALNMYDLATRRGLKLDLKAMSEELKAPVIPTIAVKQKGVFKLLETLDQIITPWAEDSPAESRKKHVCENLSSLGGLSQNQGEVDRILSKVVLTPTRADIWTYRFDQVLLHPLWGGCILVLILFTMFQAVFSWADTPMGWIEKGVELLGQSVRSVIPGGVLQSFVADGMVAGVGSVLVFLPQILILFFFILLLEGTGYMARAAFLLDRFMAMVGLQGRAFVPLLSSFACAIPGMMATRTIRNPRDRLLTIMITPLMTCSARLPVYTMLIGAFVPPVTVIGPVHLQGLTLFGLFFVAVLSAMGVAFVLKSVALPGTRAPLLLQLPTYKIPRPRYLAIQLWQRATSFVKRAGMLILPISIGLWLLSTYPRPPEGAIGPDIHYSIAGRMGHALEPLVRPLGFDWRIATGLVPGFAAREVMVSALGTVFAVEDAEEGGMPLLQDQVRRAWGIPTGLALLAWYIFAPQCLATFAVMRRETNSIKWTGITFAYMLALAYVAAFLTYRLASLYLI